MTKRILIMFLLMFAVGLYAMTAKAQSNGVPSPTQTAQSSQTPIIQTCKIYTGIDGGAVNLRACAGTSCAVMDIVTEGESLNIVKAGLWLEVVTDEGMTGYINSKYCKGK
jgi:uncharacterized membrane protein